MANQSETLCWTCKNACGKCPWSECDKETRKLKWRPVEGWRAIKTDDQLHSKVKRPIQTEGGEKMIEFPYCVYPALKKVFCERQYTRRQLADAVGISKSNIWWWLSGNNQHTIDVIKGILRESGLTFEEAFGGAE